jgi:hypothetical protein
MDAFTAVAAFIAATTALAATEYWRNSRRVAIVTLDISQMIR